MRIDRYLSHALNLSRKEAHKCLKAGLVKVDHRLVKKAAQAVTPEHTVTLNDNPVTLTSSLYLMLHKPPGYVCANSDSENPTVFDLLPKRLTGAHKKLQIAGRLDKDTTGLLLITSDGQWNHRITSPKSGCTKTYRVELAEPICGEVTGKLERGVLLRNETKPTLPCTIKQHSPLQLEISLTEGRYHQIKRLFASAGNKVTKLHRTRAGNIHLPHNLAEGASRLLTRCEVESL